jgi:hypothetical protein
MEPAPGSRTPVLERAISDIAATRAAEERAPVSLLDLVTGCWISQAIHVAAKLGIADLLASGPKSCGELAAATATDPGALYRVLRALASVRIFAEDAAGRFQLTPLAEELRTGSPGSLRALAIMIGEKEHWRAWESMLHSVRTGQSAFEHVFGAPLFRYFSEHGEAARIFDDAMTSRSGAENAAIISACDFSAARVVVDVGGGQGSLLASILRAQPDARGVLFDRPGVRVPASARCEFVAGDFFVNVPAGGDVYVLKRIIHDWDDDRARVILSNCRKVMRPDGRLLVIEPIVPAGNGPSFSKLLDMLMLVWQDGGRERTEAQHRSLLTAAGFRVNRMMPAAAGASIIEAMPA